MSRSMHGCHYVVVQKLSQRPRQFFENSVSYFTIIRRLFTCMSSYLICIEQCWQWVSLRGQWSDMWLVICPLKILLPHVQVKTSESSSSLDRLSCSRDDPRRKAWLPNSTGSSRPIWLREAGNDTDRSGGGACTSWMTAARGRDRLRTFWTSKRTVAAFTLERFGPPRMIPPRWRELYTRHWFRCSCNVNKVK